MCRFSNGIETKYYSSEDKSTIEWHYVGKRMDYGLLAIKTAAFPSCQSLFVQMLSFVSIWKEENSSILALLGTIEGLLFRDK
jgi:hypothetical protein